FALESCVDEAAHRLGIDPVTLRRKWESSDVRDGLYDWVETIPEWRERRPIAHGSGRSRSGVGVAIGNWFNAFNNASRVELAASREGVVVRCASQDMGQGVRSVLAKPVSEELGIPFGDIEVDIGVSTHVKGPASSGSRTTATLYPIALEAAQRLKAELVSRATTELGLDEVEWIPGGIRHARGAIELAALVDELGPVSVTSKKRGGNGPFDLLGKLPTGDVGLSVLFEMTGSVCVMAVEVDTHLGLVRPTKAWMGVSAGRIANPELARSQVEGAVVQGIGFALTEERQHDPLTGTLLSSNLEDYRIPGIGETPEIEAHFDESHFERMRGGACGMSELVTLPVPAALANAVFHATGWRPRTLPLGPRRIRELMEAHDG
ncbi:MAG: molybdopterin cofactor-binding domain-containing protein, partial [Gemmatimonadota bacterium]|nr:molybdopterin cofactor-binding domain-containing protein [Gemmatimonadota bacterium]